MRTAEIQRDTSETQIRLFINLDGSGKSDITTDCGFMRHMLTLFSAHSRFDLTLSCHGDSDVDFHHSVEDMGIVIGSGLAQALGDKRGIRRYGFMMLPMDEALVNVALDFSGRSILVSDLAIPSQKVGDFDTELVNEFMLGLTRSAGLTLHIQQVRGTNSHHIIEATFKGFGRAMREAVSLDPAYSGEIPSTKGIL